MKARIGILLLLVLAAPVLLYAQRDPVLKQIDLPHSYYYREMFLPQVTTGPGWVAWAPDSKRVVYSMQGYLWIQELSAKVAQQITASAAYDYQPDWSPDGKWIVFARYKDDAVELWLHDVAAGTERQLTSNKGVNVEPRWSPDGRKIAFVSTAGTGHFHIFLAEMQNGEAKNIAQLTEERKSKVWRYYYSAFDHEISPTWSPDSSEIIFVSNNEDIYGSGGFWRMKAGRGAIPREIRYEETTWKARPDWARDGKRVIYSSYLGRQWNQLWVMTADGGDVFPLTYGEYDNTNPRWSPDLNKIAFISNRNGNTELWIQDAIGGRQIKVEASERKYKRPVATLRLSILGPNGKPVSARVSVTDSDGRAHAPDNAWMHADDSFVRAERPFEPHYFHQLEASAITVPAGKVTIEAMKGFEHEFIRQDVELKEGETRSIKIQMKRLALPPDFRQWISADLHVHMNYGGHYRNEPKYMLKQAAAENLAIVYNLIVNKEQRVPDISYFMTRPDPASSASQLLMHSQEFHTSHWGHMGVLNLKQNYLIPDYVAYPNTAAASLHPTNALIADLAHEQGALLGYVHPFDTVPDPSDRKTALNSELPADVGLGKMDYFEVVGFSDHLNTSRVWYKLLNCGFRLPAGAGTDAMSNYASLRGPVGTDRTYVRLPGKLDIDSWNAALKKGQSFVTNGPLLKFSLEGKEPGDDIQLASAKQLSFRAMVRSIVPIDHVEIVQNGQVIKTLELTGDRKSGDFTGILEAQGSGWYVLRAWTEKPTYPILDIYPYATTSPIYVQIQNRPMDTSVEAKYFTAWIDRLIEGANSHPDYNTPAEKEQVLKTLKDARAVFEKLQ